MPPQNPHNAPQGAPKNPEVEKLENQLLQAMADNEKLVAKVQQLEKNNAESKADNAHLIEQLEKLERMIAQKDQDLSTSKKMLDQAQAPGPKRGSGKWIAMWSVSFMCDSVMKHAKKGDEIPENIDPKDLESLKAQKAIVQA